MAKSTQARRKPADSKAKTAARAASTKKPETQAQAGANKPPAYMQAKLAISHPQDGAEKEANKVARQIARAAKATPIETNSDKSAQRESLEPGIAKDKEESLALKPVPATENIQRLTAPANSPSTAFRFSPA